MKNPKCRKCLQLEIPELNNEEKEHYGIEKEISMASRLGAKGKFEKVTSIKNKLKKKHHLEKPTNNAEMYHRKLFTRFSTQKYCMQKEEFPSLILRVYIMS